ncbi:MAG: hypothetical protein QNJ13_03390 [Paracoccaceae bacterium]|nr:hypothetical protein [Paracoccaceae bacterium]
MAFQSDITRVWSDTALEARVAAHLGANEERFGEIDWDCLAHAFSVLSQTSSVEVARGAGGGVVYRFVVDRGGNPLAVLGSAEGGVFVAVVEVAPGGRLWGVR